MVNRGASLLILVCYIYLFWIVEFSQFRQVLRPRHPIILKCPAGACDLTELLIQLITAAGHAPTAQSPIR